MAGKSFNAWLQQQARDLDGIILDIDGVLLGSGQRLSGSRSLLEWLRNNPLPYVLLTNDADHSIEEKAANLQRAGLEVPSGRIISCGHGLRPFVAASHLFQQKFFVMGDLGNPCYAEAAGLVTTRDIDELDLCSGVIVGEAHYSWEPVINAVVNFFITHPQALLIVPNPDEFYPGKKDRIQIAAGGVARFIVHVLKAYGLALIPHYLGKPYPPIFQLAQAFLEKQLGNPIPCHRILVVGDNLAADVAGGKKMGFRTVLMMTGVTTHESLVKSGIQPDLVFARL